MTRVGSSELFEAEELIEEVASWTDEEVESLPRLYREKAQEYRQLMKHGEE